MRERTGKTLALATPGEGMLSMAASLRDLPPAWSVEPFRNYEGEWSLVLSTPDDDIATYVITESPSGFELAELVDDALRSVGERLSPESLLALITARTAPDRPTNAS